jgi:hypothetical protein
MASEGMIAEWQGFANEAYTASRDEPLRHHGVDKAPSLEGRQRSRPHSRHFGAGPIAVASLLLKVPEAAGVRVWQIP